MKLKMNLGFKWLRNESSGIKRMEISGSDSSPFSLLPFPGGWLDGRNGKGNEKKGIIKIKKCKELVSVIVDNCQISCKQLFCF